MTDTIQTLQRLGLSWCKITSKQTKKKRVIQRLSFLQMSLNSRRRLRSKSNSNVSNQSGHLAAKDSRETLAKEQRTSHAVSGELSKQSVFFCHKVRGQRSERVHTVPALVHLLLLPLYCIISLYSFQFSYSVLHPLFGVPAVPSPGFIKPSSRGVHLSTTSSFLRP